MLCRDSVSNKTKETQTKKKVLLSTYHTPISRVGDHEEYRESWIHIYTAYDMEEVYLDNPERLSLKRKGRENIQRMRPDT